MPPLNIYEVVLHTELVKATIYARDLETAKDKAYRYFQPSMIKQIIELR